MQKLHMLSQGTRIGVALSGGVDSFTLLKVLRIRQGIVPFPFEIMALHINPGFDPDCHRDLLPWLTDEGIACHIECADFGPKAHTEENWKKSPCFRCAWLRRKHLFSLAERYKLTHLAFGHNADDLVTTFFMNVFRNGKVAGMKISESFFGGALQVIRPLLLVEKKTIKSAARQWNLPVFANPCPSAGQTARSEMEERIRTIGREIPNARSSVLSAIRRWQFGEEMESFGRDEEERDGKKVETVYKIF